VVSYTVAACHSEPLTAPRAGAVIALAAANLAVIAAAWWRSDPLEVLHLVAIAGFLGWLGVRCVRLVRTNRPDVLESARDVALAH
ncbi:MAG: hypothetical protein L0221_17195, partial [Chloroflexi bacterium]|nr:hypothetical protein [Chloroflexota bacterium]